MKHQHKRKNKSKQIEALLSIRKPATPAQKVIPDKSKYNRKDKSWKNEA